MKVWLIQNAEGEFLVRDDEFTILREDAFEFDSKEDAQSVADESEVIVEEEIDEDDTDPYEDETPEVEPGPPVTMFVYGTLKRGHGNNHYMDTCKFIGEAVSADSHYSMVGWGVPFLREGGSQYVKGEVWEVNRLALHFIDRLEGHPRMYCRHERSFILENGVPVTAWVYIAQSSGWNMHDAYEGEVLTWPRKRRLDLEDNFQIDEA